VTAAIRAWVVEKCRRGNEKSGIAAVCSGRIDGRATSAGSRFISTRAGETSAGLPGTSPSVHQVERTWNGDKCAGGTAIWQEVFLGGIQD
jgi:hypothetical protein